MTFPLLALIVSVAVNPTMYRPSDMYILPKPEHVTIGTDDSLFVLNRSESVVYKFDDRGNVVRKFGSKGQGPGEFTTPIKLMSFGDRIFIYNVSPSYVSEFRLDGDYVSTVRLPKRNADIFRISDGWLLMDRRAARAGEKTQGLHWFDDDFQESVTIAIWDRGKAGEILKPRRSGVTTIPYNPASDVSFGVLSRDLDTFFVNIPGNPAKILVVDVGKKIVRTSVVIPSVSKELDVEWAEQVVSDAQDRADLAGRSVSYVNDFPRFFPQVRRLYLAGRSSAAIERWNVRNRQDAEISTIDVHGKIQDSDMSSSHLRRIVASDDNGIFISVFDNQSDQYVVVRCNHDQFDDCISLYPVDESNMR